MTFLLLICSLLIPPTGINPANYHDSYPAARQASKTSRKDLVVFFTAKDCIECDAAWKKFESDGYSTQHYISTRMDIGDFDGGVMFEMMGLSEVPSWVIISTAGAEKERWKGTWKGPGTVIETKPASNPPAENANVKSTATPPPAKQVVTEKSLPTPEANTNAGTPTTVTTASVDQAVTKTETTKSTSAYHLQAGYFGSSANAQKLIDNLTAKGFSDFTIKTADQNGTMFYRVISTMYATEEDALKANTLLSAAGFVASVKKESL